MPVRLTASVLLVLLVLSPLSTARSEVIHGFQELRPTYVMPHGMLWDEAFDFSSQTVVTSDSDFADLLYYESVRCCDWYLSMTPNDGVMVTTPLEELEVAPDPIHNNLAKGVYFDRTYVMKTGDGLYAKFAVRELNDGLGDNDKGCCSLTIEYYVQMDGSPSFGPSLPVRTSTWGSVKALYR